jgi:formylglycine-generating enzyme required for sulfatase activity
MNLRESSVSPCLRGQGTVSLVGSCLVALIGFVPIAIADETRHETYTQTIPDSEAFLQMVAIPGGEFLMGSPEDEPGRDADEGPQRRVRIEPFWMSSTEVTWDLYDLYLYTGRQRKPDLRLPADYDPARPDAITRPTGPYVDPTLGMGHDGYPAISMSHHAAMEFCRWLSVVTGKQYRLPTEAEWEYACRAGTETRYFFGNDPADLPRYAWFWKNSRDQTNPVGLKKPNPWGLYDMYGNVAEWCLDGYGAEFYAQNATAGALTNPVKLPGAERYPHVVRGGSWVDSAEDCRSAARAASDPTWNQSDPCLPQSIWYDANADFVGFRVVRAVEEQEDLRGLRPKVVPYAPEYRP